jgi:hypothetical protein
MSPVRTRWLQRPQRIGNTIMSNYTDLLYNRPTFFGGMARCLDIGGTLREFNTSPTGQDADRIALASDWYAIGEDMRQTVCQKAKSHNIPERGRGRR